MNRLLFSSAVFSFAIAISADTYCQDGIPTEITTPDHIQSKLGELDFNDGYPSKETAEKLRDELDYLHGVEAFMNSIQGVSLFALRKGLGDVGIKDGEFFYTTKMLDSNSLLLTANADTVYFWGNLDLSDGPLVVETPPMVLGIFDDFWFRWVGDFGLAGPDKGQGGLFCSSVLATTARSPKVDTLFESRAPTMSRCCFARFSRITTQLLPSPRPKKR